MNTPVSFPSETGANIRAVTLVEILVSVVIIAILAALMFPAVRKLGAMGKEAKCLGNHRAIIQAVLTYAGDRDGTLPGNGIGGANDGAGFTAQKLSPSLEVEWRKDDNPRWKDQWICPCLPSGSWVFPFSYYAFSRELFGHAAVSKLPVKISAISQPSKSAAFACVVGNYVLFHSTAYTHAGEAPSGQLSPYHRGGGTIISFMDGHSQRVEAFGKDDPRRNWFWLNHPDAP